MPTVTVLSCPVCAAPLQPESPRCDYCGSVVVIQTDHPRLDPQLLNLAIVNEHIAKFRATLRHAPNDETARYGLGVAYFNLGLLEDAAEELTQAARLMPENPHIQFQLAVVYADLSKAGDSSAERAAWDRVNRALLVRPKLVDALLLKAELHLRRAEWQEAVAVWRQAMEVDADSVRRPIATFLSEHDDILIRAPEYSGSAARTRHREFVKKRWNQAFLLASATFLGSCVLFVVLAIAEVPTWVTTMLLLVAVVAPIGIAVYTPIRWRLKTARLTDSWNALETDRQHLLTAKTTEVRRLLDAAKFVGDRLVAERRSGQYPSKTQPPFHRPVS